MENWKPITGYEDYEVSDLGRVRRIKTGKILKSERPNTGYLRVSLSLDGKQKHFYVHRLVAFAFLPTPEDPDLFVCHKDGSRTNNVPSNLYFGTQKENGEDMIRHGRSNRGEKHGMSKLTGEQVDEIRLARMRGETQRAIAERFGLNRSHVGYICRGVLWAHRPMPTLGT